MQLLKRLRQRKCNKQQQAKERNQRLKKMIGRDRREVKHSEKLEQQGT